MHLIHGFIPRWARRSHQTTFRTALITVLATAVISAPISSPVYADSTKGTPTSDQPTRVSSVRLPDASAVPGGIVHIPINHPEAHYGGHRVMVLPSAGTPYADQAPWVAIVGIPLSAKPGDLKLQVNGQSQPFTIGDKAYREQRLKIKNKRHVNPEKRDLDRIGRERKEILGALANWHTDQPPVTRFELPAQGPFSSPFGLKRFFNDQPRAPHRGLDIAAPKGSPIVAPAPGVITAAGDYFFNGRNLILDHGHGLVTMYSHMDRIDVAVGDRVETGDRLGTIGNSGRVTGPHLHWTVSLNNVRVDPALFIDQKVE